jgi:hypothetical protein
MINELPAAVVRSWGIVPQAIAGSALIIIWLMVMMLARRH